MAELLPQVTTDDVLEFGLIPELVGRLPVISALAPLNEEALVRVLTEPKNALVKQYQSLFEMEESNLSFTDEALLAIAHRAHEKGTGARGLRSIIEHVMLDIMFELPDQEKGTSFIVDNETLDDTSKLFTMAKPKKSA